MLTLVFGCANRTMFVLALQVEMIEEEKISFKSIAKSTNLIRKKLSSWEITWNSMVGRQIGHSFCLSDYSISRIQYRSLGCNRHEWYRFGPMCKGQQRHSDRAKTSRIQSSTSKVRNRILKINNQLQFNLLQSTNCNSDFWKVALSIK